MLGTMKMFCIGMNILSHRNNIVLFLACNMAAVQNLYIPHFLSVYRCNNPRGMLGEHKKKFVYRFYQIT